MEWHLFLTYQGFRRIEFLLSLAKFLATKLHNSVQMTYTINLRHIERMTDGYNDKKTIGEVGIPMRQ